ncbi:hypothetical protein AgCh_039037 [Apium graveolens]
MKGPEKKVVEVAARLKGVNSSGERDVQGSRDNENLEQARKRQKATPWAAAVADKGDFIKISLGKYLESVAGSCAKKSAKSGPEIGIFQKLSRRPPGMWGDRLETSSGLLTALFLVDSYISNLGRRFTITSDKEKYQSSKEQGEKIKKTVLAHHNKEEEGYRAFRQTRSRTRKRTLDTDEETDSVLDIPEKIDFEDSDKKSEKKEHVIMGDRIVPADPALMDFSQPKIDDIQSNIIHPAIQANTFKIKPGTIQMVQNSVSFGGAATEDPNMHIRNFVEICSTFKYNGVTDEAIKLRLLPFSLRDKAKDWLHSLPARSITTWEDLA